MFPELLSSGFIEESSEMVLTGWNLRFLELLSSGFIEDLMATSVSVKRNDVS